jgi:hypothetical protein
MLRAECGMIWECSAVFNDKESDRLTRRASRLENPRSAQVSPYFVSAPVQQFCDAPGRKSVTSED